MKKRLLMLFVVCIAWVLAPVAMAVGEGPPRIGVIDTQKIMKESKAAKEARDAFLKERKAKQAAFVGQEREVLKLQEEVKSLDAKTPPDVRRAKTDKLNHEAKELKRFKDDIEEELKRKEVELTTKIVQDVRRILVDFRKKEGLTVILDKSAVVVYDDAVDITDRIIKIYDLFTGMKK
jgi:outer membrane protein